MHYNYFLVVKNPLGYQLSKTVLGFSVGPVLIGNYLSSAELTQALLKENHTMPQIQSMVSALSRLGGVCSKVAVQQTA